MPMVFRALMKERCPTPTVDRCAIKHQCTAHEGKTWVFNKQFVRHCRVPREHHSATANMIKHGLEDASRGSNPHCLVSAFPYTRAIEDDHELGNSSSDVDDHILEQQNLDDVM